MFDNGHEKSYVYDDSGERVIKRGPQGETAYVNQWFTVRNRSIATKHVWAGTTRIASSLVPGVQAASASTSSGTTNGNGNGRSNGNGNGSSRNQSNFLSYYHPDHLGSSSYVTDANGKVTEHLEYFAFGETWVEENSNTQRTPYLFTAKELDEETGLYYFGARYYDPRTSVWQSPDPILGGLLNGKGNDGVYNPRNLGLYSYAYQNPIRLVDPDGNNPGPVYVPGVFGMVDYKTGNVIADNTVLAVGNTALNITNSAANVALKTLATLGEVLPDAGVIQSAGMAGGLYGAAAAGAGSMAVRGLTAVSRTIRALEAVTPLANSTTRVGRWMSKAEHDAMLVSGKVQESFSGTTHVASPADASAFINQAKSGSSYVEFNVPSSSLKRTNEGWSKIIGPNSLEGRMAARKGQEIPQMPTATDIVQSATKLP